VVGPVEPDHLEGKGLLPIIGWIPKGDEQIDLPERHGLLSRHDVVERRLSRPDARPVDAHSIERLSVHDVEAAVSIHQHLGERFMPTIRSTMSRYLPSYGMLSRWLV